MTHYKKALLAVAFLFAFQLPLLAQFGGNPQAEELYKNARSFISSGDYANAILVLNRAIQLSPDNLQYRQQLAFTYYLSGDNQHAEDIIKPLLKRDDATVQTYQIAGDIYEAENDIKSAQRWYKRGLRQFPESGPLHNEMGLTYYTEQKYEDALQEWVKGIQVDPDYAGNYYNAARAYYYSKDKVWSIIYAEIFINLNSYSKQTVEMKQLLLESYKKLFTNPASLAPELPPMSKKSDDEDDNTSAQPKDFKTAYINTMLQQSSVVSTGITYESLVMLRTRFILDWENFNALYFPFSLFDYQRELLKQGLFEAYNEWLFESVDNPKAFQNWVKVHQKEYDAFEKFKRAKQLPVRKNEFYNTGKITFEPANVTQ